MSAQNHLLKRQPALPLLALLGLLGLLGLLAGSLQLGYLGRHAGPGMQAQAGLVTRPISAACRWRSSLTPGKPAPRLAL